MLMPSCNYQAIVTSEERAEALTHRACEECGITLDTLLERGQTLDVCSDEFASDIASGERILTPVALCPACHRARHLDARHRHNPCHLQARYSREGLE